MKKYTLPPGYNLLTSIPRMLKQVANPVGTMEESMARFNGTYSVHLGTTKYIITQDPGFIDHVLRVNQRNYHKSPFQSEKLAKFLGNGLLTSNGDYWLKQRRLIQPGFHAEKIQALYDIIGKTVNEFLESLPEGRVDVYPHMNNLAFRIVINTLFNIVVPEGTRKILGDFVYDAQSYVIKDIRQPHKTWWFKLSGEEKRNLNKAKEARGIIGNIIRERKKSGEKRNDLLDMLLDARYEDTGEAMHEEQIIDEILVLIIAGHETTANALSWTLFLLARHPDYQEKIKRSTASLSLKESVTSPDLNNLIRESMRLYPPAWISDRIALESDTYGPFTFPKDTVVILFYYGLHRDTKHWIDPTGFNPERFTREHEKERAKVYFPFGSGPRLCIGNNFAMAEMAIALQALVQHFNFGPTDVEPKINALVTLKPDHVILNIKRSEHK